MWALGEKHLTTSLPLMIEVHHGFMASDRLAETSPPGGQNAQHCTSARHAAPQLSPVEQSPCPAVCGIGWQRPDVKEASSCLATSCSREQDRALGKIVGQATWSRHEILQQHLAGLRHGAGQYEPGVDSALRISASDLLEIGAPRRSGPPAARGGWDGVWAAFRDSTGKDGAELEGEEGGNAGAQAVPRHHQLPPLLVQPADQTPRCERCGPCRRSHPPAVAR